jgi:acyl-CoA thioesterase-1
MLRSWFLCVVFGVVLALGSSASAAGAERSDVKEGEPVILVLGDSLSAGYGVAVDSTWVALLRRRLDSEGYGYRVVNASVSGETTGGGRARLARALQLHRPAVLILELGGNDGLRGLPLKQVRGNLDSMIEQARTGGSRVLLVGMRMPPNYGRTYADQFHGMYAELAKKHDVALVPFFLDGVAENAQLMQPDQIHPTAAAQPRLLDNLWPTLRQLLEPRR